MPDHKLPNNEMTIIGPDTRISGEVAFNSTARILGTIEGKIIANAELQIGPSANCQAAIEGKTVIVDGGVEGPVHAADRLTLSPHARVVGDIRAGTLVVAEGASFVGHCQVGPQAKELAEGGTTMPSADIDFKPPWKSERRHESRPSPEPSIAAA
ncbi:MAG: polymer-forming cytoskeletal protein [Phycisphaerales bacterium]